MNSKIHPEKEDSLHQPKEEIKIIFFRWIILAIFCFNVMLNTFNWIEYSIIQDVTIAFYNESLPEDKDSKAASVNWLSIIYMVTYLPFGIPAMFLLDRKGLRLSLVLGEKSKFY